MIKTSTPTLEIKTIDVNLSEIQSMSVTIKQPGLSITKSSENIGINNGIIVVNLTQSEEAQINNSGGINVSVNAVGYSGETINVKVEWAKIGSRTEYEGGGGTQYDILPTVQAVENNSLPGKLVDALAVKEVFQSVSSGKELIASAITDKGVQTDATATFQQMANNIGNIPSGGGSGGGTLKVSTRTASVSNANSSTTVNLQNVTQNYGGLEVDKNIFVVVSHIYFNSSKNPGWWALTNFLKSISYNKSTGVLTLNSGTSGGFQATIYIVETG